MIDAARENLDVSAQDAEAYLLKLQNETKHAEDLRIALEEEREAVAMKYAGLEVEAARRKRHGRKNSKARSPRPSTRSTANPRPSCRPRRQGPKNKLEKERSARKAELNRAVVAKIERRQQPRRGSGGRAIQRHHDR